MTGEITTMALIGVLLGLSLLIGALIGVIVFIGDLERMPILRALDKLPGVVAAVLTGLCCFSVYHLIHDLIEPPPVVQGAAIIAAIGISAALGWRIHRHRLAATTAKPPPSHDVITRIGGSSVR